VPEVDLAERRRRAGERDATAARDADVLGAVLRGHAAPVEAVVVTGDGLAQLPDAGHRGVLVVRGVDVDSIHDSMRAGAPGSGAGLGLTLAQVAPAPGV
jgi:hypothetical protein